MPSGWTSFATREERSKPTTGDRSRLPEELKVASRKLSAYARTKAAQERPPILFLPAPDRTQPRSGPAEQTHTQTTHQHGKNEGPTGHLPKYEPQHENPDEPQPGHAV